MLPAYHIYHRKKNDSRTSSESPMFVRRKPSSLNVSRPSCLRSSALPSIILSIRSIFLLFFLLSPPTCPITKVFLFHLHLRHGCWFRADFLPSKLSFQSKAFIHLLVLIGMRRKKKSLCLRKSSLGQYSLLWLISMRCMRKAHCGYLKFIPVQRTAVIFHARREEIIYVVIKYIMRKSSTLWLPRSSWFSSWPLLSFFYLAHRGPKHMISAELNFGPLGDSISSGIRHQAGNNNKILSTWLELAVQTHENFCPKSPCVWGGVLRK